MDKNEETPHHDIIDEDLYEEFDDEELLELVEAARIDALEKARERKARLKNPKPPYPKWIFWVIAVAMLMNIIALLPQTISIPAIDFLKTSAKLSAQEDIKEYKQSVVVIETEDSRGTGFSFTSDGNILTNYHVVEGNNNVTVAFKEDGLFNGRVKETYPEVDLAVVEVDGEDLPHLTLADEFTLTEEEPIYFIGNPLRFTGIANEGYVKDYAIVKSKEDPVVMMDAPVYRGNSGSPVIDEAGMVIGVVFATLDTDEAGRVGLFIPIDYFHERYSFNGGIKDENET